tara:strand:+ start:119 stop:232 length:114 start_codon:yes stop_codon:yes gene_type:complete
MFGLVLKARFMVLVVTVVKENLEIILVQQMENVAVLG